VLAITLLSILVIFGFAWCAGLITRIRREGLPKQALLPG